MLASELAARQSHLEREQKKRIEQQRIKLNKEKELQERAKQRQAERDEQQRQQRLAIIAEEERIREREFTERERNRGVYLHVTLNAIPADEVAIQARGIKRAADKVSLPPSVSAALLAQDAQRNGAMLFELSTVNGTHTHVGVLDFSAPEGCVAIPSAVAAELLGPTEVTRGDVPSSSAQWQPFSVFVSYRRLEKGEFVRFQPVLRGFHEHVGGMEREVLESALLARCCLTEGDTLEVTDPSGHTHVLKVVELQPEPAVSIIDTDISAEVIHSQETEKELEALEGARRREEERLAAWRLEAARKAEVAAAKAAEAAEAEAVAAAMREQQRLKAELALLPEPSSSSDSSTVLNVVVRMPDGSRPTRRFLLGTPLEQLFLFVDSKGGIGIGSYNLVTSHPRRVLSRPVRRNDQALTIEEAGLTAGQEVFFVEQIS